MDIDGSGVELYNLDADPGERRNLAMRERGWSKRLSARLGQWIAGLPTPGAAVGR